APAGLGIQVGRLGAHPIATTAFLGGGERTRNATMTGFAIRMPEAAPLLSAPGTIGPGPALGWINRDGFIHLAPDPDGRVRIPTLRGYRTWAASESRAPAATDSLPPVPAASPAWPPR